MNTPILILLMMFPGIIIATTLHEFTRAAVSTALGDELPKKYGRLTLNPIRHFEPVGFILMFATNGFGWGKPVDTSSLHYKNRKRDTLITAIAPNVVNLIVGLLFAVLTFKSSNGIISGISLYAARYNIGIAVYNFLPVSPMDCVKVLSCVLPANTYFKFVQYEKLIQMFFLLLLFMGFAGNVLNPIINTVISLIFGIAGII